ncbi:recombinase family protein [Chloroflexota bacterium]
MMDNWAISTLNGVLKNTVYAGRYYALKKQAVEPQKRRVHQIRQDFPNCEVP